MCDGENMDSAPTLDDAILLAAQKHHGQKDLAGAPYVMHVLRVMFRLRDVDGRIVAVLHDLAEQTDITPERLKQLGYPDRIVEAVDHLTWRKEQESYEQYIKRLKSNSLATTVKKQDIKDHLAPNYDGSVGWLEENRPDLYERYRKALFELYE
jgi:(p)ppGpp synthase/HD superfamily hydrolase